MRFGKKSRVSVGFREMSFRAKKYTNYISSKMKSRLM